MSRMRFRKYLNAKNLFLKYLDVQKHLIVNSMYMAETMSELLNEEKFLGRSPTLPCMASSMKRKRPACATKMIR